MPLIFDESTKKHLRKQMLENGFQLIKLYGLKRTTIEDVTRKSGVAKGTFYNFFKNKEEFVYEIIILKRDDAKEKFQILLNQYNNKLNKLQFKKYLEMLIFGDYNLFLYLTDDELSILKARWPQDHFINEKNDETTSLWLLSHLTNVSKSLDWKIFSNYLKALAIIQSNKDKLHQDVYNETLNHFIDNILDYIFND